MKIHSLLIVLFLFSSCSGSSQEKKKKNEQLNEQLTQMNKNMVGGESKRIDAFIKSRSYNMEKTGTGLRYEIYSHGKGVDTPLTHTLVELKYKMYLLNGTLCYSSDSSGNAKFRMGEGNQVRGLEEGVALMRKGDKARLVLPTHLAYGISGDGKKIPPAQPIFLDIEIIDIKK